MVSLVGGELIEAGGFAGVFWQAATTLVVEEPEVVLRFRVSLVGGELEETRGLAVVSLQSATTLAVEEAKLGLSVRVSLVSGEPEEASGLASSFGSPPRPRINDS